jgi:hypothetical protein
MKVKVPGKQSQRLVDTVAGRGNVSLLNMLLDLAKILRRSISLCRQPCVSERDLQQEKKPKSPLSPTMIVAKETHTTSPVSTIVSF